MSQKLYYENPYNKEFKGKIINILEKNNEYHVELEGTYFFPGGGGQPADTGFIDKIEVKNVYEENGSIYHVLESKPKKTENLNCIINWENRLDGMQQHLAQHVLSGCFYDYFNANTVSFHLGHDVSTVDIMGFLEEDKIREAEKLANEAIKKALKVEMLTPSKSELKKLKLRRDLPKTNEEIRVVKIEDLDINACCGLHPQNTIELQLIKIRKWEKNKGNTRIEYVAGGRAIKDFFTKDAILNKVSDVLTCGEDDIVKTIENLLGKVKTLGEENNKIKNQLSSYELKELISNGEKVGNFTVIKNIFNNEDSKYLSKLASKLTSEDNIIVLFANISEGRANIIFNSSKTVKKLSMNNILKDVITLIDGKGGGSDNLAQGAGKGINNLENAFDYALRVIKEKLS